MSTTRLLLIDGHSMAFRAFFALPAESFTTAHGQHTNAVHGFFSMLLRILESEEPSHVAVAFDLPGGTFRTEEYSDYKAGRAPTPEEFQGQVPLIREMLDALGITQLSKENYEADDILATLATVGVNEGMEVLVVSGDRDTFQLVTPSVTVLYPVQGVIKLNRMTPDAIQEKFGVPPERYPEIAALVGEKSDNLPGVPGVGPGFAAKWINQFDGLDNVIARADEIGGKKGEALRAHISDVIRNRQLNRLVTTLDLAIDPHDLHIDGGDPHAVVELCDTLEFNTLRDRLVAVASSSTVDTPSVDLSPVERMVRDDGWWDRAEAAIDVTVQGGAAERIGLADATSFVSIDLIAEPVEGLAAYLSDETAPKVLHSAKSAWHAFGAAGYELNGVTFDTELAAYLCDPGQRSYTLETLMERHLGRSLATDTSATGELDLGLEDPGIGSRERAAAIWDLAAVLRGELEARGATRLLTELELPVQRILQTMEATGIAVDEKHLQNLHKEFDARVNKAAAAAHEVAGKNINLSSPKQLQEVLFEDLGLPKTRKTKTGYTTDAESLAELYASTQNPFLAHLLDYREQIKLKQIVETLMKAIQPDGRIHTTYQQTIAATGRLSSMDPNLQNIPIRTPDGMRIREAFVVGEGYETLISADYSQVEMRVMASLSGDEGLIDAFNQGEDLHRYVASRVFGVPADEVSSTQRGKVKAMSYGLVYGLSAYGLSRQLSIDVGEARDLMNGYFSRFGGVKRYLDSVVADARKIGYTETIMGRRRYMPDLNSDNRTRREAAERMALNAPIQGSAADVMKQAMINVAERLDADGLKSRILLQIHDELVLEVAPGEKDAASAVLVEEMARAADLKVPLTVSVGVGRNWSDAGH